MSKSTHSQGRGAKAPLKGQTHGSAPLRQSGSSIPAAAAESKPLVSHLTGGAAPGPTHEQIAVRAYRTWEARGRPEGTDREDWFEAERSLRVGTR